MGPLLSAALCSKNPSLLWLEDVYIHVTEMVVYSHVFMCDSLLCELKF